MQVFTAGNAMLRAKTMGNYPNAQYIMSCVYEGMLVDLDTGLKIESRYFVACTQSTEPRNMIRSLFFSIGDATKQIGSAHVCTPVTNAHIVCRLLLEQIKQHHLHTK